MLQDTTSLASHVDSLAAELVRLLAVRHIMATIEAPPPPVGALQFIEGPRPPNTVEEALARISDIDRSIRELSERIDAINTRLDQTATRAELFEATVKALSVVVGLLAGLLALSGGLVASARWLIGRPRPKAESDKGAA